MTLPMIPLLVQGRPWTVFIKEEPSYLGLSFMHSVKRKSLAMHMRQGKAELCKRQTD